MIYLSTVSSFLSSVFAQINTQYSAAYTAVSSKWAAITAVCTQNLANFTSWMTTQHSRMVTRDVTVLTPSDPGQAPARASSESHSNIGTGRLQSALQLLSSRVSQMSRGGPASAVVDEAAERLEKEQAWLEKITLEISREDWARCPTVLSASDGVVTKERADSFAPKIFAINKADRGHSRVIDPVVLLEWALRLIPSSSDFEGFNKGLAIAKNMCKDPDEINFSFSLLDAVQFEGQVMRGVEVGQKNQDVWIILCPMIGVAEDQSTYENVVDDHFDPISFKKFIKPTSKNPLRFNLNNEKPELVFYAVIQVNPVQKKIKVNLVIELHKEDQRATFNGLNNGSITDFTRRFEELEDKRIASFMKQVFQTGT